MIKQFFFYLFTICRRLQFFLSLGKKVEETLIKKFLSHLIESVFNIFKYFVLRALIFL